MIEPHDNKQEILLTEEEPVQKNIKTTELQIKITVLKI